MKKILVMGGGSAQSNGVINCLLDSGEEIIAAGCNSFDLSFCKAKKKYLIPHCTAPNYKEKVLKLFSREKPDLVHFQHDQELLTASSFMQDILDTGVGLFIPSAEDIDTCVHKHKSYLKFKEASVKVPENIVINNEVDLKEAFDKLSDAKGDIWIRSLDVGGGGKGSLATSNYEFAKNWIDHYEGWGSFAAAEMLSPNSVTFLTIWNEGEILVGQGRSRHGWSGRSMSGVTGVTKVGKINNDPEVVKIAIDSINAISEKPHGIWAVDMSYDRDGIPNPTEINIGRFFTTVQFFKELGLNMPEILKDIAIYGKLPNLENKINPLSSDQLWLRAMDEVPRLGNEELINFGIEKI